MQTQYAFIDGAYARERIIEYGKRLIDNPSPDVNWRHLCSGHQKTFYYDCPPPKLKDEDDATYDVRVQPYWDHIHRLRQFDGWHIFHGTAKKRKKGLPTQKEVDVQIAVDLLSHSFRKNMDRATLFAGDQDFRPVVDAVVREGMTLHLQYSPLSISEDLLYAADARSKFSSVHFLAMLDPSQRPDPFPQIGYSSAPVSPQWLRVKQVATTSGRSLTLFKTEDRAHVYREDESNSDGNFFQFGYADLKLLDRILDVEYGDIQSINM